MTASARDYGHRALWYLLLALFAVVILLPVVLVVSVSFMPRNEFFQGLRLFPSALTLESYKFAFDSLSDSLVNSFLTASGTVVLTLLIAIPGAYVFARKEFPGKKWGFYAILTALAFPYLLLIIPIADVWTDLGLFNTIFGLILSYQLLVVPFTLWILRDFFEKLPYNLEEVAMVYGCSEFSAFVRVVLPLSLPAIISTGFIAFVIGWSEFLFANVLTTSQGPRTAPVQLFLDATAGMSTFWGRMMAETVMVAVPTAVLYYLSRQYLSESFEVS